MASASCRLELLGALSAAAAPAAAPAVAEISRCKAARAAASLSAVASSRVGAGGLCSSTSDGASEAAWGHRLTLGLARERESVRGQRFASLVAAAKFQTFSQPPVEESKALEEQQQAEAAAAAAAAGEGGDGVEKARDDDVLPEDLADAIRQSGEAAALFCNAGGTRALVEMMLPEFDLMSEDGAQQRLWDSGRAFLDGLKGSLDYENVRAIFPDAGAAAMLKYQWGADAAFAISSLNDRQPVSPQDDVVVLVAPDYQMLERVERIAGSLAAEDGLTRPIILWNPRLFSGDVGIGLNVRRTRQLFLSTFSTVYYIRPLDIGAIYRCYPSPWNLFLDDASEPGRYILFRQQGAKPTADDIDELYLAASGESRGEEGPNALDQVFSVIGSFSRFMRSLTK